MAIFPVGDDHEQIRLRPRRDMNVLFLHSGGNWMRGSENALLMALRGLKGSRITPLLFSSNTELIAQAQRDNMDVTTGPLPQVMVDGNCVSVPLIAWAMALRRVRSVIHGRDVQLVYCNGGSTCQIGYYAAKLAGIPVICHLHSPYNRRYIVLYRLPCASTTIFVSRAIEQSIRQKQTFAGRCEVVYNGVDTQRFAPVGERDAKWRERLGIPADAIVFGQVSSLILRKGVDILLRAFSLMSPQHSHARLVIVGDGPERPRFEQLVHQLGIQDLVVFTGHQTDPLPYYQHVFDVTVMASRSDAFPLSLLEASSCGLPTVGATVDGIPEAIADRVTGYLFTAADHTVLAGRMSCLATSTDLRRTLGSAGRVRAVREFSLSNYCQNIERLILEALEDTRLSGMKEMRRGRVGGRVSVSAK